MKIISKEEIYMECGECQQHKPHLHFYIKTKEPKFKSKEDVRQYVLESRQNYYNSYGKDGFLSDFNDPSTYFCNKLIDQEVDRLWELNAVDKAIEKVACLDIRELENYQFLWGELT